MAMSVPLNLAPPSTLDYFATLVAQDEGFPLLEAAAALGHDDDPQLDVQSVLDRVDGLADRLRRRLPPDAPALQRLRTLNRYFFQDLGFAGNVNDYQAPANSYLHRVLDTRRGIPISLAVLYIELATQNGLRAQGVSFPGHFLVKVHMPHGEVVMDPFSGESLSRTVLEDRLEPYRQQRGLVGEFDAPLGLFLQPASGRDTIARMLNNLKALWQQANDSPRLLAVQDRLVRLLPEAWEERRDRGLVLAELNQTDAALRDLNDYLHHRPDATDATAVRRRIAELRDSPRPLLH